MDSKKVSTLQENLPKTVTASTSNKGVSYTTQNVTYKNNTLSSLEGDNFDERIPGIHEPAYGSSKDNLGSTFTETYSFTSTDRTASNQQRIEFSEINIQNAIEKELQKYVNEFQPQLNRRLSVLAESQKKDLEERLDKLIINERAKNADALMEQLNSFRAQIDDSKATILGSIAIFSGIISYISVSVTLFDNVQGSFEVASLLISIMLTLICFLSFLIASLNNKVTKSTYLAIISLSIIAILIAFTKEFGTILIQRYL